MVIHHGGVGTVMWAMVNHVPLWGCASDLEKHLNMQLVNRAGPKGYPCVQQQLA
jgi:UDP:flavonoid glycosyltransferase YjiC (YdhE family)